MATKDAPDVLDHSPDEVEQMVQRFEADYNAVEQYLRDETGRDRTVAFVSLEKEYKRLRPGWRDDGFLLMIAEVRNVMVHRKTEPYGYVAVPTPATAERLHSCRDHLTKPERVFSVFRRAVETVSPEASLERVLHIVAQRDYSQFPVYAGQQFRGLLTENGITRWLARNATGDLSLERLRETSVEQVLKDEEQRENCRFVAKNMRVDDVAGVFSSHKFLEAVLITADGKASRDLLGIATRWDIIQSA